MSPLSEGQRRQAGVTASLGGSSVEECAEPLVDVHLLIAPFFSPCTVFTQEKSETPAEAMFISVTELADQHVEVAKFQRSVLSV